MTMVDRVSRHEHPLLAAPADRVVPAARAMGTMSQAKDPLAGRCHRW
jgi:hypothetical protein